MGGICRVGWNLFAVAVAAVLCVGMWGCTDVDFHWESVRRDGIVLGFIDDSLAIVGDYRCWEEYVDEWNGHYEEHNGCGHERLCVYNYRVQEDGPRWCDSLSTKSEENAFGGQMADSIIWGGNLPESIKLWKVGGKPHEIKLSNSFDKCSGEFSITSVKQWFDGTFIARGDNSLNSDGCQYAVLDTVKKTLTYKRLDDDLKWIEKCDDVRAWGNEVYCLALLNEPMDLYLLKNNEYLDSLLQGSPYGWASYTKVGFSGNLLNLGNNIFKIQGDRLFSNGVSIRNALEYKLENGIYITY